MNIEQVVRSYLSASEGPSPAVAEIYLASDLVVSGGMLSQQEGQAYMLHLVSMLREAFPDFRWNVSQFKCVGDQVKVRLTWGGTHRGLFYIGDLEGIASSYAVEATGRLIRVPDTLVFTVRGSRISRIRFASGPEEGYMALLQQLCTAEPVPVPVIRR